LAPISAAVLLDRAFVVSRLLRIWLTAAATGFLAALISSVAPAAADEVKAIATGGEGNLTMCPGWVYRGCNLYHHIELPSQMAVGDMMGVRFGSNPKRYRFPVARILRDGDNCTVFSQIAETENVEKIEVASCRVAIAAQ
jgi:hypothetical protein